MIPVTLQVNTCKFVFGKLVNGSRNRLSPDFLEYNAQIFYNQFEEVALSCYARFRKMDFIALNGITMCTALCCGRNLARRE